MTIPPERSDRPLAVSQTVLRLLVKVNVILGALIAALLAATFIAGGPVMRALGVMPAPDTSSRLMWSMRGIMVIGVLATPVMHRLYTRLLLLLETVNAGDPFSGENAARLQAIAWAIVGLELMHVGVVVLANGIRAGGENVDIGGKFSVAPSLTILLLFVLARVFDQGTRMRDELSGTV